VKFAIFNYFVSNCYWLGDWSVIGDWWCHNKVWFKSDEDFYNYKKNFKKIINLNFKSFLIQFLKNKDLKK